MGYLDNSGLYVKIGTEVATPEAAGEYNNLGPLRMVEFIIPDMTKLTLSDAVLLGADNFFFPTGVKIEKVTIITDTACTSGGSATLIMGLQQTDRSTLIDATGVVNAVAVATLTAGSEQVFVKGTSGAGTRVGTGAAATTLPAYITAKAGTAVFTAGAVRVRVEFYRP